MLPFTTCEVSLGQYVFELVSGVNVFYLDFLGPNWFDRITNQAQLCGSWKRVSLWDFFLFWSSWSLLRCLQTHTTKLPDGKIWRLREHNQHYPSHWSLYEIATPVIRVSPFYHGSELCFQELKQSDPIDQEREYHLTSILHPKKWFLILLNCAKLKFVSCTSNLLEQMYDFQKHIMSLHKWIWSPQDLLQNRSLETVPVCIVLQYYPHSNTVSIHMCDQCMKSIDSGVCHKPWSILWWIVRAYLLTMEYQVVQFLPSISISGQFGSMYLTSLQQILFLLP